MSNTNVDQQSSSLETTLTGKLTTTTANLKFPLSGEEILAYLEMKQAEDGSMLIAVKALEAIPNITIEVDCGDRYIPVNLTRKNYQLEAPSVSTEEKDG